MFRLGAVSWIGLIVLAGHVQAGAIDYFSETSKDFGTTPKGPVLVHQFSIKNKSNTTVTMGTPRIQCGCVSVNLLKATLAPGEETTLVAYMDTKKIPVQQLNATKTVSVYVPFLSPVFEEVTIKVTTLARDDLFLSPDVLALGSVRKGQTATGSVKLTMFTQPNWEIQTVKSSGAYISATSKLAKKQGPEVTYEVTATLDKECPVGNWTSEVIVKTNVAGLESFRIPVTVNVMPLISINPGSVRFGDVSMGSQPSQQLILQSADAFKVVEVKGAPDVKITTVTEGQRAVHIFKVSLDPKSAGAIDRQVEILTDNKSEPRVLIPVSALIRK